MIKKAYENIKSFVKEEYKFLICLLIVTIILTFPLPYYVITGGGITDITKRVIVDNEYSSNGSFNFTFVKELNGTTVSYLYGKLFKKEIIKADSVKLDNESIKDYQLRERIAMMESYDNAIYSAYKLANKEIKEIDSSIKILYILKEADTDLKVGDEILKINDVAVNNTEEYQEEFLKYSVGDELNVLVKRNGKEIICRAKVINYNGNSVLGLYIYVDREYETIPKVSFNMKKRESGPSGGLMLALTIYNKLVEEDITKGYRIAGTGTIDINGNIGEIGGIKYKLEGAVKKKANIFIAPSGENYQEVVELVKKNNYNIKVIEAKTLSQVINDLS